MTAIIDCGMGNVGSILNMLKKIGVDACISSDIGEIEAAARLILPGVGAFDNGMRQLEECSMLTVLHKKVIEEQTPILGICLGMQLMTAASEEGEVPGLNWFDAETVRFRDPDVGPALRVPHMGWNQIDALADTPLLTRETDERFYFAHSYHAVCSNTADVVATSFHGSPFAAIIQRGHIVGVQFHPEKSHRFGKQFLAAFCRLPAQT